MLYKHTFIVQAPLEKVAEFHRASASMALITPPPVVVRIHKAPLTLVEGDEMHFTLWLGPLPLHWLAKISNASDGGFTDKQIKGPFKVWEHQHLFQSISPERTRIIDQVRAEPKEHWFWNVIGWLMWWNLPLLFAFRSWKTRWLLAS